MKKPKHQADAENIQVLEKILAEGLLAQLSIAEEVKILLLFSQKHVAPLSQSHSFAADLALAEGYLRQKISARQLAQREAQAESSMEGLDAFEQSLQALSLMFLNRHFLDGCEQDEDIGSFLFRLAAIQSGLCEAFYQFLKTG